MPTQRTHQPVMTTEVVEFLNPQPGKLYIDATFGAGGHTGAILSKQPLCKVIALDIDQKSLEFHAGELIKRFGDRLTVIWGNFAHLYRIIHKHKIPPVAGIVADLGTSKYQIFNRDGFSFLEDSPLDMRMSSAHTRVTAADLVNTLSEKELTKILFEYGQERYAKLIARNIVERRATNRITTTRELATIIERVVPRKKIKSFQQNIHPATRTFQAIRIAVNDELNNLKLFLPAACQALEPNGRLVCISFHSLEDRPIKQFFVNQELVGAGRLITRKPIGPTSTEVANNPSSRSAKLRVLEQIQ